MTTANRAVLDPYTVITVLVADIEPDLPQEAVKAAIGRTVRSKPAAVR